MNHFCRKCSILFGMVTAVFLMQGAQVYAMEDAYRFPMLSGPTQTWVYQGEDYESSRNKIFADDQEDGDLTTSIQMSGTVDTSQVGNYQLTYQVKDSDGKTAQMVTKVKVLEKTSASAEDKTVQRTLYTLPAASHLTDIGFYRGYYHDRQSLGFWIPGGTELKIRIVNSEEFKQSLELKFMNNDSKTETMAVISQKTDIDTDETVFEESDPVSTAYLPSNGEWLTVKNCFIKEDGSKGSSDSVPFVITPKDTTVQPVIEIVWNDSFQNIPYYRYGDDQTEFFREWDESQAPFAIVEGDAATFLIPVVDRNNIINHSSVDKAYQFQTIDEMLEWYAAFVKQYDTYVGLDYDASEAYNQNVRAKFFIKVNNSGIGAAYYTIDHSANNGEYSGGSLGGYLTKNWVSLHEFGHGYEGSIAQQEHPFVETTNNILGYYFEPTYRPDTDFGWMLNDFSGSTKAERYAALGKRAEDRRNETSSFAGIVQGAQYYNVSLFMFTNVLDKLGPQETVAAMHTQYRKYYYENGKTASSSDVITESFSRTGGYNVVPYFDSWHIQPSEKIENEIYSLDLPMVYYLKNLVEDEALCEAIRVKLGLDGIYSLVSTDELAYTGYTSQVSLQISIDDFSQIQNKTLVIKNGLEIVKEIPITAETMTVELPIGIYEVELPTPDTADYHFENEYLVASKGSVEKEFCYSRVENALADDTQIQFLGVSDNHFATVSVNTEKNTLLWSVKGSEPHFIFEDTYAGIRVLNPSGTEIFSQSLAGNQTPEESNRELSFPVGSKIEIYHREAAGRLKFVSSYTGEELSAYKLPGDTVSVTYVMTDRGLMQEGWDEKKQADVYLRVLASYSEVLLDNMTWEDLYHMQKSWNQIATVSKAYEFLDEESKAEYLSKYGILVGKAPESYTGYKKIASERLTGLADSDQGGGEAAAFALDGNEDTIWHSNYGNGTKPDLAAGMNSGYTILLDKNTDIGKLEYVPRKAGSNGVILSCRLLYSTTENGDDFQEIPVKTPVWENDDSVKSVEFDAPDARRIRIVALSTGGNPENTYISAAEFYLYEKIRISAADTSLSDLYLETSGAEVEKDRQVCLYVNGQEEIFERGVTLAADSAAEVDLTGKNFDVFCAVAGVDVSQTADAEAMLSIYGDGILLYQSGMLSGRKPAESVYLNISGVSILKFKTTGISGNAKVSLGNGRFKNSRDLTELTLKVGESAAILANTSLVPQDRGQITWKSSNEAAAVVSADGVVTAVGEGTAEISGVSEQETITCTVSVVKISENNQNPDVVQNPDQTGPTIKQPAEPSSQTIQEGQIYNSGKYYYKVISNSQKTVQVTGLKNAGVKKVTICSTITLGGQKYTVISIAPSAFKNNKKITSVTIQKNVQVIGKNAFAGCVKLKRVIVKSTKLKNIGAKAFYNCKKLTNITIKSKMLKKAGKNAFKGIHGKAVIKVPSAKLKAYKKILAKKGQSSSVKIK